MLTGCHALVPTLPGALAAPPVNTLEQGFFGGRSDTAILGYDPVACFTAGRPVKGLDTLVLDYPVAKWKFASQAHLDLFKANPDKYAPQYGGYCAYGVARDSLVSIAPDILKIVEGKLYLDLDADVQARWLEDPAAYIRQADARVQTLLKK